MADIRDESGGRFQLVLQADGNLVSRRVSDEETVWSLVRNPDAPAEPGPDPDPPPDTATLPPISGAVGFDGSSFTDDTGRRIPLMCHAGDLILTFVEGRTQNDPTLEQRVHAAFSDMRDAGYSGLRSWTSIGWVQSHPSGFWGTRMLSPSDSEHRRLIAECLRIGAQDYGIVWHVALGDVDNVPRSEVEAYFDWLGTLVSDQPTWFALVEGVNESDGSGESDARVVEAWVNRCRSRNPETLHALSAAAGVHSELPHELEEWTPDWQEFIYTHAYRGGHWGDQMRHVFSVVYPGEGYPRRRNGWSGEPTGVNRRPYYDGGRTGPGAWVSVMNHPEEWYSRPWRYALYMAHTAMCRQVPTYFSSPGVKLDDGRLRDQPAFGETPRLVSALPPDVMSFDSLIHGGTTWRGSRVIAAPDGVRVDQVLHADGRVVMTVYPNSSGSPTYDTSLPFTRTWTGRVHYSRGHLDATVQRGENLTMDVGDGLLLVGRLA